MVNGELYNFREVRADLEKRGHKFRTQTDVEIVPHLYEIYGDDFLDHINGMFAIALWDTKKKKLTLARDRFGEKPLYYGWAGHSFLFGSELKALLFVSNWACTSSPITVSYFCSASLMGGKNTVCCALARFRKNKRPI